MTGPTLQGFKDLVRGRCGLMLEGNGEETLKAAIAARMQATGVLGEQAYLARLTTNEAEFQELVTLLTINETYFFREPEQLALLTEKMVPRLLALREPGRPLRILSAGCSTGEEPYSIAMALLDQYGEAMGSLVRLYAGDIDHLALAKARAGHYSAFSFRALSPERQQRYFAPIGRHGFALAETVRTRVEFHHLNLLSAEPPASLHDFDIVLFRNVSIYFDADTRRAIQHNLARMMTLDGVLLVGTAETLANDLGVLRLVEEDGHFYFAKGAAAPPPPRPSRSPPPAPPAPPPKPNRPVPAPVVAPVVATAAPAPDLDTARRLIRDKRHDEAGALLRGILAQSPDHLSALVLLAHVQVLRRDYPTAQTLAQRALELDAWSVEAMVVQGFAAKWQGDHDAAIRWFKQAVYTRHHCWVAQYYLAESYRAAGQPDLARRTYRVALQHLTQHPDGDGGLSLPLGLPVAEVRFLCERHAGGRG
ncbi:CheR family methyltransferase [Magnetospirillum gryphiswaldense]|uniref:CheR family methyltransferase n=1 Tax=Magnetospirillum gryphiswaldense TaxID=55518 RepID=UPI000D034732|nr:protein-glutamate O-methyltransferase CheR [Magnetospirillum gryphiswaldense]AVM75150.1 chemotaxis protein methyltransferase [Magnetospirillum gryphiswaldense MSR-1]AVM79053.1 chemotaxis protein methyltransferase [Magnetospirillum gryphiswaldense]